MDPLSAILRDLAVDRAVPLRFESRGPYAMRFGHYEHLKFGAVLSGRFSLCVEGEAAPIRLRAGDCYLLTNGRPYRTFNGDTAAEIDGTAYFQAARDPQGVVRLGDAPPDKVVIGGRFIFDPAGAAWLRQALPPVIHIRAQAPEAEALRTTLELLRNEMAVEAPGRSVMVDRLADLLLVQAIRVHLASGDAHASNWLAAVADPQIGRAMQGFHAAVASTWTVASLAAAAGMSRSSFAERFRARVGIAPMDYVARWRLYRIRRALIETDRPFAVVAAENGYRSRASCSQSFQRLYGHAPMAVRRSERADLGGSTDLDDGIPMADDLGVVVR